MSIEPSCLGPNLAALVIVGMPEILVGLAVDPAQIEVFLVFDVFDLLEDNAPLLVVATGSDA